MNRFKPAIVPLASFALAAALALFGGPTSRALSLRAPAEETGKCQCQLKVLDISGKTDWKIMEIGADKTPHIDTIKVHIEGKICQERPSDAPAADVLTDAMVDLTVGALLSCNGKPDGDEKNLRLTLTPQKKDSLTCPGQNYSYTWDGDQDSLRLAAFAKFEQLHKIEKKNCEVLEVFLQLQGAGKTLDYRVSTETHCAGVFDIKSCEDSIELREKKGMLAGTNAHHSKNCSTFVCRFGTP